MAPGHLLHCSGPRQSQPWTGARSSILSLFLPFGPFTWRLAIFKLRPVPSCPLKEARIAACRCAGRAVGTGETLRTRQSVLMSTS